MFYRTLPTLLVVGLILAACQSTTPDRYERSVSDTTRQQESYNRGRGP